MVSLRILLRRCCCRQGRLRFLLIVVSVGGFLTAPYRHPAETADGEVGADGEFGEPQVAPTYDQYDLRSTLVPAAHQAVAEVKESCAGAAPAPPLPTPDGLRHVVQYNVLNGVHDLNRRHRLCAWLHAQQADVVTFNELNFWDQ